MEIDELLNFIESKDIKKINGKKSKKKVAKKSHLADMDIESESAYSSRNYTADEDSEFEKFKSKILFDSIDVKRVHKIKPIITQTWD